MPPDLVVHCTLFTASLVKVNLKQQTSEIIGLKEPFLDFRFL